MLHPLRLLLLLALFLPFASAQETHDHGVPEKLGKVSFPISCAPAVQDEFNRGVALLHSFAYSAAKSDFQSVVTRDPQCAMAHWGVAMTYYQPLWQPPVSPATSPIAEQEIGLATQIGSRTERERGFIRALSMIFESADTVPCPERALRYERAMSVVASQNKDATSRPRCSMRWR